MSDGIDWSKLIVHDDQLIGEAPQPAAKGSEYIDLPILPATDRPAVAPQPESSLLKRVAKRMFGSFMARAAWFVISPFIFSPAATWKFIVMVATFISSFGGEEAKVLKQRVQQTMQDAPLPAPSEAKQGFLDRVEAKVAAKTIDPLKDKAREVKNQAVEKADNIKKTAVEAKEDAKEKVVEVKEKVEEKAGEMKKSIEAMGNRFAGGNQEPEEEESPSDDIRRKLGALGPGFRGMPGAQQGRQTGRPATYNAQCPHCAKPMRIPPGWHNMHACSGCKQSFDADDARRLGRFTLPGGFR